MSQLPQGGESISAELDQDVARTLKGRLFGPVIRVGALAVSAGTAYAGQRLGVHGWEALTTVLPGASLSIGVGVKLGVERAAALARLKQREELGGNYVGSVPSDGDLRGFFRTATFGSALAANALAAMGGAVYAATPRDAAVTAVYTMAYAAAGMGEVLTEATIGHTGRTLADTPPEMHQHLFGTGEHFEPFSLGQHDEI